MWALTEANAVDYLRQSGRLPTGEVMVKSLTGGVASTVLMIFEVEAGDFIGTDLRSPAQIKRGIPDLRSRAGRCYVLKQPEAQFRTAAEWKVDTDRLWVERDCMQLLNDILPAGSLPQPLWWDEANNILAMTAAPSDAIIWKKLLLDGICPRQAAEEAGLILAMLHTSTTQRPELLSRYGNPRLFIQQRVDAYLRTAALRHPDLTAQFQALETMLLTEQLCLIHGDYTPKNIFVVPEAATEPDKPLAVDRIMLLDFEVVFYSHPAFDVASLINHLLLKAFHRPKAWRGYVIAADAFWRSYCQVASAGLSQRVALRGGQLLGALLIARVDGKSPVEYINDAATQERIRELGRKLLNDSMLDMDSALDYAGETLANLANAGSAK